MCSGLAKEFNIMWKYFNSLTFEERPNYDSMIGMMKNLMNRVTTQ